MNLTALLDLPYPSPTSAPCDFDEEWCQFTDAVKAVLDRFAAGAARTIPAVPAAMLHIKATFTALNLNPVPFTDVVIDTAGMTNMDADPYGITVPKTARYTVAFFMGQNTSGSLNAQSQVNASPGLNHQILDRNVVVNYYNGLNTPVIDLAAGTRVTMSSFVSPVPTRTAFEAWLSVIWHSDMERPS